MLRVTIVAGLAAISCGLTFILTEWRILHVLTMVLVPSAVLCVFITYILSQLSQEDDE